MECPLCDRRASLWPMSGHYLIRHGVRELLHGDLTVMVWRGSGPLWRVFMICWVLFVCAPVLILTFLLLTRLAR